MRIIAGKYKNLKLKEPNGSMTHPMGDREKMALFNMILPYLDGARILDAYAGTGALGIEAISRGACEAVLVEKDGKISQVIKSNLHFLEDVDQKKVQVLTLAVEKLENIGEFDLILADPPYDNFKIEAIAGLVQFLKKDGILVLSHPGEEVEISGLALKKSRKYAGARISIYSKN